MGKIPASYKVGWRLHQYNCARKYLFGSCESLLFGFYAPLVFQHMMCEGRYPLGQREGLSFHPEHEMPVIASKTCMGLIQSLCYIEEFVNSY